MCYKDVVNIYVFTKDCEIKIAFKLLLRSVPAATRMRILNYYAAMGAWFATRVRHNKYHG